MAMIRLRKFKIGKRWQWRVKVAGLPPIHGTCPTKECAAKCSTRAEQDARAGRVRGSVTLRELADLYSQAYLPTIPDSAPMYTRHLALWVGELGDHLADAIAPPMIAAALERIRAGASRGWGQKKDRPRSPATVNRYLNTLCSVYTWANQPDVALCQAHPARAVRKLQEPRGRVRWVTRPIDGADAELPRLLEACRQSSSRHLFDVVLLLLATGCRENEIIRLRGADVRLSDGGFLLTDTKTETPRFVHLDGAALEVLRVRVEEHGEGWLFPMAPEAARGAFGRRRDVGPALFPRTAWRTALRRAGIENLRPHDLRHTMGSWLAMLGKTLPEIMRQLGHKTAQASMRYVHLADQHAQAVSKEVGAALAEWSK